MGQRKQKQREKRTKTNWRENYHRLFICLFIALILHKLIHGRGLVVDNYIRLTPRYILWRLLEEQSQVSESANAIAA